MSGCVGVREGLQVNLLVAVMGDRWVLECYFLVHSSSSYRSVSSDWVTDSNIDRNVIFLNFLSKADICCAVLQKRKNSCQVGLSVVFNDHDTMFPDTRMPRNVLKSTTVWVYMLLTLRSDGELLTVSAWVRFYTTLVRSAPCVIFSLSVSSPTWCPDSAIQPILLSSRPSLTCLVLVSYVVRSYISVYSHCSRELYKN